MYFWSELLHFPKKNKIRGGKWGICSLDIGQLLYGKQSATVLAVLSVVHSFCSSPVHGCRRYCTSVMEIGSGL